MDWQPKAISPEERDANMTPAAGFARSTLASRGVPWPPPSGWKRMLIEEWRRVVVLDVD